MKRTVNEWPPTLIRIGTAGWTIPKPHAPEFPPEGTHLQRYAQRFPAVEINSSFYRPHKPATYARWAASVPLSFRFAVKLPREITHTRKLNDIADPLDRFLSEVTALGDRLGPLLIQLPPSLAFDQTTTGAFFNTFRARFDGPAVCEPRHPSWFTDPAEAMLRSFQIARAAADPAPVPRAAVPGGYSGLTYHRLHGSPRMYYSQYDRAHLDAIATTLSGAAKEHWCIFDNTAIGHATSDALALMQRLAN
jgi:uncharacterized protein YecE (DUF72 family)